MKLWQDKNKLQSALLPVLTEHEDSLQLLYANDDKAPAAKDGATRGDLFYFHNIHDAIRFEVAMESKAPEIKLLSAKNYSPLLRHALKNDVKKEDEVRVYPEKVITPDLLEKMGYKKQPAALYNAQNELKEPEQYWQDVKRTLAILSVDKVNKNSGRLK